jgi:hypothetical protein
MDRKFAWSKFAAYRLQGRISPRVARIGLGEIFNIPLNGVYIARMMKIADETQSAQQANVTNTMVSGAAKSAVRTMEQP